MSLSSFIYTQLNDFKYRCVSPTVQLNNINLFALTHNDQAVPFQAIQFSISHLFTLSVDVKQFYSTHR